MVAEWGSPMGLGLSLVAKLSGRLAGNKKLTCQKRKAKVTSVEVATTNMAPPKKASTIKIIQLKLKPGARGTSKMELVLAKASRCV
jgi:hypothetical protein